MSKISNIFKLDPQIKSNIKFDHYNPLLQEEINYKINTIINNNMDLKIIVRKSGTEKVIRVLVEGKNQLKIEKVHNQIVKSII